MNSLAPSRKALAFLFFAMITSNDCTPYPPLGWSAASKHRAGIDGTTSANTSQTASLSLIASLGACTRSCFVPRYRSVVCTDAWPRSI